jgi:hypothetical protein
LPFGRGEPGDLLCREIEQLVDEGVDLALGGFDPGAKRSEIETA